MATPNVFQKYLDGGTPAEDNVFSKYLEVSPLAEPETIELPVKKGVVASLADKLKKGAIFVSDLFFKDEAFEARQEFESAQKEAQKIAEAELKRQLSEQKNKFGPVLPQKITETSLITKPTFPTV